MSQYRQNWSGAVLDRRLIRGLFAIDFIVFNGVSMVALSAILIGPVRRDPIEVNPVRASIPCGIPPR
jgi:hypothetical protein